METTAKEGATTVVGRPDVGETGQTIQQQRKGPLLWLEDQMLGRLDRQFNSKGRGHYCGWKTRCWGDWTDNSTAKEGATTVVGRPDVGETGQTIQQQRKGPLLWLEDQMLGRLDRQFNSKGRGHYCGWKTRCWGDWTDNSTAKEGATTVVGRQMLGRLDRQFNSKGRGHYCGWKTRCWGDWTDNSTAKEGATTVVGRPDVGETGQTIQRTLLEAAKEMLWKEMWEKRCG